MIHGVSFLRALLSASQTGCSLMGLKKTNAAFAALVFFGTHYIITTFTLKCYWIFCQMYCQLYAFFLCTCIKTCCFPDLCYIPIFDSQIYQNTAESLILPGFFSGAFSFYYIVFFLNQIWMIDFYDFSRDCLLSFWISFIFLLVRNS